MKLGLVSLGCDKNTVDSERLLAALAARGARVTPDLSEAEVIVVNTCGFIDAAKEETIETLLDVARYKTEADCRAVVAVGCMVEKYGAEMREALPEVDLMLGLREIDRLVPELRARGFLGEAAAPERIAERLPLGPRHVGYLKVSEGCDHGCAFCAIPSWRGRHRSFGVAQLVAEARRLEAQGTVELNLVAQDLAHFGRDLHDGTDLVALLRALLEGTSIPWIRLLYVYSAGIREPLVALMAAEPRLLPYLDMPIQHASDPVLRRMRRPERMASLREKISWMRSSVPELTLRTTVMVGFPGETDEDFQRLLDFMEEIRFERLGAFSFSPQDGTRAAAMEERFVPAGLAAERLEELLEVQRAISAERMAAEVGRRRAAIVDRVGEDPFRATGRIASQADDVDGTTDLLSREPLEAGLLLEVEVREAEDFDLRAEVREIRRHTRPPGSAPPGAADASRRRDGARRPLPIAALGLETVRGR